MPRDNEVSSFVGSGILFLMRDWKINRLIEILDAESHGKTIRVESDAEKITTFTMVIPNDLRPTNDEGA